MLNYSLITSKILIVSIFITVELQILYGTFINIYIRFISTANSPHVIRLLSPLNQQLNVHFMEQPYSFTLYVEITVIKLHISRRYNISEFLNLMTLLLFLFHLSNSLE